MRVVLPKSHSEWLQERKYGIGASESASILGMGKWKSNLELWEEKVGLREPEDIGDKPYVQYGHDAEAHLRALFALDHPELRVTYESPYKIIRNEDYPFIFCTPDGELEEISTGRKGGLEIKTTEIKSPRQWSDWKDRIPDQYYCQLIHQFIASGWDFIWIKAQIKWYTKDGEMRLDTREHKVERAEVMADIDYTRAETIKFWDLVEKKKRPALKLPSI